MFVHQAFSKTQRKKLSVYENLQTMCTGCILKGTEKSINCSSVVLNFSTRFLAARAVMDATHTHRHLAPEPRSAALRWQAWWMPADENMLVLWYSLNHHLLWLKQKCSHCNLRLRLFHKIFNYSPPHLVAFYIK